MTERFRYNRYDPDEQLEKMTAAITLGVDPDDSGLVRTDEDRKLWRRLARSIAAGQREGLMIVLSHRDDDDEEPW